MTSDQVHSQTVLVRELVSLIPDPEVVLEVKRAANAMRVAHHGDRYVFASVVCSETHQRLSHDHQ